MPTYPVLSSWSDVLSVLNFLSQATEACRTRPVPFWSVVSTWQGTPSTPQACLTTFLSVLISLSSFLCLLSRARKTSPFLLSLFTEQGLRYATVLSSQTLSPLFACCCSYILCLSLLFCHCCSCLSCLFLNNFALFFVFLCQKAWIKSRKTFFFARFRIPLVHQRFPHHPPVLSLLHLFLFRL